MNTAMASTPSPTRASGHWFAVVDGARLRQLRRQHGLSTVELAGKAGIGLSTVIRWNASRSVPAAPAPWLAWLPR